MMKFLIVLFISIIFSMTGEELSILMDNRESPNDVSSELNMEITNKKGRVRKSKIKSISKDNNAKQILWFLSPADDKGVSYLKIEHDNQDDEIRLWLPGFKKIRRISSNKKADSFMGSDLSYEDMTSRQIKDYTFEITNSNIVLADGSHTNDNTDTPGKSYYILESTPNGIDSEYSRHVTWVEDDTYLTIKEESYDKNGNLLKLKKFKYQLIDSFNLVSEIFVENIQKKSTTKLVFSNLNINTGVKNKLFQEKNMKRLPRK